MKTRSSVMMNTVHIDMLQRPSLGYVAGSSQDPPEASMTQANVFAAGTDALRQWRSLDGAGVLLLSSAPLLTSQIVCENQS